MHANKTFPLAIALTGIAAPALAVEQGETYLGGGFGMGNYTDEALSADYDPTFGTGRIGYGITDHVAIEGRLGFDLSDDTQPENPGSRTIKIDQIAGIYGVGYLPVVSEFSLYGLAGVVNVDVVERFVGPNSRDSTMVSETDFSYGIGAEVGFSNDMAAYVEWVHYFEKTDEVTAFEYDLTGVTIGAKYTF